MALREITTVLLIGLGCTFLLPLTAALIRKPTDRSVQRLVILITGVGLSIGGHAWLLMVSALITGTVQFAFIPIIEFVAFIVGSAFWLRVYLVSHKARSFVRRRRASSARSKIHTNQGKPRSYNMRMVSRIVNRIIIAALLLFSAVILINALVFPLSIDDAVTIYGYWGAWIAHNQVLPTGGLYEAYPPLIQLWYASIIVNAGWQNDFLIRLIPAILSLLMIPASYLIGRLWRGRGTGLIAAYTVALTPIYGHWSSTGYVDLPTGGLIALAIVHIMRMRLIRSQVLAGLLAGFAAMTKNTALVVFLGVGLYFAWQWWTTSLRREILVAAARFGVAALIVGAPWYIYTWVTSGVIVAPTGWTWLAQRTLSNLVPYLTYDRFLPLGILYTAGMLYLAYGLIRRSDDSTIVLMISLYIPFFAAWFVLASYDVRFLLAMQVVPAVGTALLITDVWRFYPRWRPVLSAAVTFVLIIAFGLSLWNAVDHKTEFAAWLSTGSPDMTDTAVRRALATQGRSEIGAWITAHPDYHIAVEDARLLWSGDSIRNPRLSLTSRDTLPGLLQMAGMRDQVFIASPDLPDPVGWGAPIATIAGYRVFMAE